MNNTLLQQFKDNGYVILRDVIPAQQIAAMREAGNRYFSSGRSHMSTRAFVTTPALSSLPFGSRVVESIRRVFGEDYVTISQFSMMANLHSPQWHRDSQSQLGHDYLFDPEYLIAKCAV